MLNQVVLVGRLVDIEKKDENSAILKLSVKKNNMDGKEFNVPILLSGNILEKTMEYIEKGDIIGIKGSISLGERGKVMVSCEKISFLSSNKRQEQELEQ